MRLTSASILVSSLVVGLAACGDSSTDGTTDTGADADATAADSTAGDATQDATAGTDVGDATTADATADATADSATATDATAPDADEDTIDPDPVDITTTTDADDANDTVEPQCVHDVDCQALSIIGQNLCVVPRCIEGQCAMGEPDCADEDPCTVDTCVRTSGACKHEHLDVVSGGNRYRICPGPLNAADAGTTCINAFESLASFDTVAIADDVTNALVAADLGDPWVSSVGGETCSSDQAKIIGQPQCRVWQLSDDASCATVTPCEELHAFVCEAVCEDNDPCTTDVIHEDLSCTHEPVRHAWSENHEVLQCPGLATWEDARYRCSLDGGILAMPATEDQKITLRAIGTLPGATPDLWAPLQQPGGPPADWEWVDGGGSGEPPWCEGVPDNLAGDEFCSEWSSGPRCLEDMSCGTLRSFACVIDTSIP